MSDTLSQIPSEAAKSAFDFVPKLLAKLGASVAISQPELTGAFNRYADSLRSRHEGIKGIVLRDGRFLLEDVYVPLTLVSKSNEGQPKHVSLASVPYDALNSVKRLLIVDTAGMGKSTALRFLLLRTLADAKHVPYLVDLRRVTTAKTIMHLLLEQLSESTGSPGGWQKALLEGSLATGQAILFLDGYDEVKSDFRSEVSAQIQDIAARYMDCAIVVTSREEQSLSGLNSFNTYSVRPLTLDESFALIRKYARALGKGDLGESLIAELRNPKLTNVRDYLHNPLLTSLLFCAYEYKQDIPLKKSSFYSQVFEALYDRHDLSKPGGHLKREKLCGLDNANFARVVRRHISRRKI
jgi:predicted NACHT family NTPase